MFYAIMKERLDCPARWAEAKCYGPILCEEAWLNCRQENGPLGAHSGEC